MFSDGMIGQKSVLLALSALTTGNLNSKLGANAKAYKMHDILPMAHEYIIPPLSEEQKEDQAQKALLAFVKSAPNAPKKLLNG
jgi:hypothetical protein